MDNQDDLDSFIESLPVGSVRKKSRLTPYIPVLIEMQKRGCSVRDMHTYLTVNKSVTISYEGLRTYILRHKIFESRTENIQTDNKTLSERFEAAKIESQKELSSTSDNDLVGSEERHPTMLSKKEDLDKTADKYIKDGFNNPIISNLINSRK